MAPRNVIVWLLCLGIVVLLMSTSVQAKELTEVNATDILKQIENEEDNIYYDNVRITGELDLSNKDVKSNITITNSVFESDVDFFSILFMNPLDFSGTSFSGETHFRAVRFSARVYFVKTSFIGDVGFISVGFSDYAVFRDASFSSYADFRGTIFSSYVDFGNATFSDYVDFEGVSFNGWAEFSSANFSGDADFGGANFIIGAIFRGANFNDDAFFNFTKFSRVFLSNTKFTKISLNDADFERMKVSWDSLENVLVFDGPTYMRLIKNFREMEQFEDADSAYYQYRRLSQANKGASVSKLGDVFMWLSCGYGVRPLHTIGLGVAMILLFALSYWQGNGIRRLKEIGGGGDNRVSFWDALYFSMVTFTTVGFGDWYPVDRYRVLVMIEGFVGWLTLALFLVTLANVMIRP